MVAKTKPALAEGTGSRCFDRYQADRYLDTAHQSDDASLANLQAHHLAQRFGLTPAFASVVADLAFTTEAHA